MSQHITFYNTLSRQKEQFEPIHNGVVSLYTCGPTVYAYPQIGNWVAYIRWDTLVRMLQASGYKVERVMNITDVGHLVSDGDEGEDKLEKGARREGMSAWQVADFYTADFMQGMKKLNLLEPTYITRATDFIDEQISLVKTLEEKGFTYVIEDGVYFDTSKFKAYADFARLDLDELKAGARIGVNAQKKNPSDFALWKLTPQGQKRDMEWESPWGRGFPGWHLECSAMALNKLGETIDIHTGGIDHIPVHHTNEIAQSEAATGKIFARFWLHNNFLMVDSAKASKSLGNAYTLQDIEQKGFDPLDFRMFALQSHYRTESNFTWGNLMAARNRLQHWREMSDLAWQPLRVVTKDVGPEPTAIFIDTTKEILEALEDDMDTPRAVAAVDKAFDACTYGVDEQSIAAFRVLLQNIDSLLGLPLIRSDITHEQKQLIAEREQARNAKNWQSSDALRDELASQGIGIRDTEHGQFWYRLLINRDSESSHRV